MVGLLPGWDGYDDDCLSLTSIQQLATLGNTNITLVIYIVVLWLRSIQLYYVIRMVHDSKYIYYLTIIICLNSALSFFPLLNLYMLAYIKCQ